MRKVENLASRMRHRVVIERPVMQQQDGGAYSVVWQEVATVWAEVIPVEQRRFSAELWQDEQLQARVSHEIRVRYREGIAAEMRVAMGGRLFNIRSVINAGERREYLLLMAEENVAV